MQWHLFLVTVQGHLRTSHTFTILPHKSLNHKSKAEPPLWTQQSTATAIKSKTVTITGTSQYWLFSYLQLTERWNPQTIHALHEHMCYSRTRIWLTVTIHNLALWETLLEVKLKKGRLPVVGQEQIPSVWPVVSVPSILEEIERRQPPAAALET